LLLKYVAEAPDDGWRRLGFHGLCVVLPSATGCDADLPTVTQAVAQLRRLEFRDCDNAVRTFAYRLYFRGGNNPDQIRLRAEWQRLFYCWSKQWGEGLQAVREYLAASATDDARRLAEELLADNPKEVALYTELSSTLARKGEVDTALVLLRRGCKTVDVVQQADLRNGFLDLCQQQWRQVEALAFLNELPSPQPPEVAGRIRSLRQAFGGLYLAEKTLPIKISSGALGLRRDGTFVVLERESDHDVLRFVGPDGHEIRKIRPPEDVRPLRMPFRCFGLFPDETMLYGRFQLSDDGQVRRRLPIPANLGQAAVNEAGEVAAVSPNLYLVDATDRCVLSNVVPSNLPGERRLGLGFSADRIFLAQGTEVVVVSREGEVVGSLAVPDDPQALSNNPIQPIVADAKGFVYVPVGDKVHVFDTKLRWVHCLSGFNGLRAVTIDRSGVLYLTTFQYTIKLIPQNGGVWALGGKRLQP
jgi:hypothetical protein